MKTCEYRVTQNKAGHNMASNVKYSVTRDSRDAKPQGAIVAGTSADLCQVKLSQIDPTPMCELPDMGTDDCPIALWMQGTINIEEANKRLHVLYGHNS